MTRDDVQPSIEAVRAAAQQKRPPTQLIDLSGIVLVLAGENDELRRRVAALEALVTPVR